jgi:hypothetical protein
VLKRKIYRNTLFFASRLFLPFLALALFALPSCRVSYSFTGASISPNVKTVTIPYFVNNAGLVVPTLARTLTDGLRDYITSQSNLVQIDRGGDLLFDGAITQYIIQPVAIQGNETAAMNRLTVTVNVKFTNKTDIKQNWEQPFSRYQDYPSSQNLQSVQEQLIKEITDQLVQDIFNKAVVNW